MAKGIDYQFHSEFNGAYTGVTRKILRLLSENARISISDIAKETGLSRRTVSMRLKKMEEELGLRYTIELNEDKLELVSPHIVLVRFKEKPDYAAVAKMLQQSHVAQFAVSLKGSDSILVYAVATSTSDYAYWDNSMQVMLSKYGTDWQPSEVVHKQLGFFPTRNEIIDKLDIEPKYKEMIKLLNENSRISFQELSKKLGMHFNTAAYNFNKLLKMNYIKRFTLTMDAPKGTSVAPFLVKYTMKEDFEKAVLKVRKAFQSDDEQPLVSRYLLLAPLIGSYDHFGVGVFDNFEIAYEKIAKYHKQALGGNLGKITCMEMDRMLIGRLPVRSVDDKKDYNVLDWTVNEERLK